MPLSLAGVETSFIPVGETLLRMRPLIRRPPPLNIGFGQVSVTSSRLLASPPDRITALIADPGDDLCPDYAGYSNMICFSAATSRLH